MHATRNTGQTHRHRRRFGRAQEAQKPAGPARVEKQRGVLCCEGCGVVYRAGHWHWAPKPQDAQPCECPACQRIRMRQPAGLVRLTGAGVAGHSDEIKQLARHQEEAEKAEHPLNRIMAIEEKGQEVNISTTDIHLPRRIGHAIRRAFGGVLKVKFEETGDFVSVEWMAPEQKQGSGGKAGTS